MSKKTKEEKLNILHDRLAEIKEKSTEKKETENLKVENVNSENDIKELTHKKSNKKIWIWLFSIILIIMCVYIYINQEIIFPKEKKLKEEKNFKTNAKIKYNLNYVGDNIVIIENFENENSAKASVNNLRIKGFKSNYFFLPNKSNSTEELYIVFIGPYDSVEEANQWIQNISKKVEIIKL